MRTDRLCQVLAGYPDRAQARLLERGFCEGFVIPSTVQGGRLAVRNLKSIGEQEGVAREKVAKEVALGRVSGPHPLPPWEDLVVSPLGIVPKKEPGRFRLIHHLSHPEGESVNDGIPPELCSVQYASVDDAVELVRKAGPGAEMAKADIESAFRLLPVHPVSFRLLGFRLGGGFYFDKCLPMGCAISCAYFEAFSTFLEWLLGRQHPEGSRLHYLDDFLFVGEAGTGHCRGLLRAFARLAEWLGVPLAPDKTEGPATRITFLGIELDSRAGVCRLPECKVRELRECIENLLASKKATLLELQQLVGRLNFAGRVIPAGKVFAKRLTRLTAPLARSGHRTRLPVGVRLDLEQWLRFLAHFNGVLLWKDPWTPASHLSLYTDAAGGEGFGAILGNSWCAERWPDSWVQAGLTTNITLLELFPIVVAFVVWERQLRNKQVVLWSDNQAVVQLINNNSARCPRVLALLRRLVRSQLEGNLAVRARHVAGVQNEVADALSRFQWQRFRALAPQADKRGTAIPDDIWRTVELP